MGLSSFESFFPMKKMGVVYNEFPGLMYPFLSSSTRNNRKVSISCRFRGYTLQLIVLGASSCNFIWRSLLCFGGYHSARVSSKIFQCLRYSSRIFQSVSSVCVSFAWCAHFCEVVVFLIYSTWPSIGFPYFFNAFIWISLSCVCAFQKLKPSQKWSESDQVGLNTIEYH